MALLMFSQAFGGALFLSFADTTLTNSLKTLIPKYAPSVNPQSIIDAGATGIRTVTNSSNLIDVLKAYSKAVDWVLYLPVGLAVASFASSWFMGFKDIRRKQQITKA
jgi:hypothetical protein